MADRALFRVEIIDNTSTWACAVKFNDTEEPIFTNDNSASYEDVVKSAKAFIISYVEENGYQKSWGVFIEPNPRVVALAQQEALAAQEALSSEELPAG